MIVISRDCRWHWLPEWNYQRKGCYTYRWLVWGRLQVTLMNERLSHVVQEQVQEAISKKKHINL
ncbi:MAG: hypothetical protein OQK12_15360 [Motiliproteus sp.]|nr:hypothetical protein [Motiliproteus sp.]MCW9054203.1 hypothetical protein [Motiliproteus sp.]